MTYRIREVTGRKKYAGTIRKLHQQTFGGTADMVDPCVGWWWLVFDGAVPVAFAGMVKSEWGSCRGYLVRVGVLKSHRGAGLQSKLISTRERKARKLGFTSLVSDTTDNVPSANNLIRKGFELYEPVIRYGMSNTDYWKKDLARTP